MSTKYQSSKDVPTSVLLDRAEQLADAVTKGESGSYEFTMRISAECDRDADLVLCELVKRFKRVNQEQTELLNQFAAYLNKRCDINVANMVRPFMEGEKDDS